ncbi:MAG TPA: hypothetical protein VD902_10540 [Symbiobacteriaceae bacterium]|nr:hypothetical protein [Symbiobacteriaceae bacterium]
MRNVLPYLFLLGVIVLAAVVLLPVLGALLLLAVIVVAVVAVGAFAAPFLAKLPWFRDRIVVEQRGGRRTVRFGRGFFSSYQPPPDHQYQERTRQMDQGDVIDVEGRHLPDKDQD